MARKPPFGKPACPMFTYPPSSPHFFKKSKNQDPEQSNTKVYYTKTESQFMI